MKINEIITEQELQELNWKSAVAAGAMSVGMLGGAQASPGTGSMQMSPAATQQTQVKSQLVKKYIEILTQRAREDGDNLDARTMNMIRVKAENAANKKIAAQQSAANRPTNSFPATGAEDKRSADYNKF